jgi:hypothetical protein
MKKEIRNPGDGRLLPSFKLYDGATAALSHMTIKRGRTVRYSLLGWTTHLGEGMSHGCMS